MSQKLNREHGDAIAVQFLRNGNSVRMDGATLKVQPPPPPAQSVRVVCLTYTGRNSNFLNINLADHPEQWFAIVLITKEGPFHYFVPREEIATRFRETRSPGANAPTHWIHAKDIFTVLAEFRDNWGLVADGVEQDQEEVA